MDTVRGHHEASQMLEQVFLLFQRTQGEGKEWARVKALLDTVQPLDPAAAMDWDLFRRRAGELVRSHR
jgi:hypothetical protein